MMAAMPVNLGHGEEFTRSMAFVQEIQRLMHENHRLTHENNLLTQHETPSKGPRKPTANETKLRQQLDQLGAELHRVQHQLEETERELHEARRSSQSMQSAKDRRMKQLEQRLNELQATMREPPDHQTNRLERFVEAIIEDDDEICPITHEKIKDLVDPVTCSDGYTYERQALETWLDMQSPQWREKGAANSPCTREPMSVPPRKISVQSSFRTRLCNMGSRCTRSYCTFAHGPHEKREYGDPMDPKEHEYMTQCYSRSPRGGAVSQRTDHQTMLRSHQ